MLTPTCTCHVHVLVLDKTQPFGGLAETRHMLDYEKLDVYRCSIEHLAFVFKSLPKLPRGFSALVDQWRRAAMSIPMNIAEAVGKPSPADRANKFAIARGEAMECGAILDVIALLDAVPRTDIEAAKGLVTRIVAMLTKLCL